MKLLKGLSCITLAAATLLSLSVGACAADYTFGPVKNTDYYPSIFIDQPEDDLDNKVIYDEVITAIAQKKPYIQFIFATHNANIPVLGDSERVLVVEFQETKIDVAQGNIDLDSTHTQIVDIMEGGKEAFDIREDKVPHISLGRRKVIPAVRFYKWLDESVTGG